MLVNAAPFPPGTTIVDVGAGVSITLSANASADATAVPARFSYFSDPEIPAPSAAPWCGRS